MRSTDIVIKSDFAEKPVKKRTKQPPPQSGILVIHRSTAVKAVSQAPNEESEVGVMVVQILDIKSTRLKILDGWRDYTPAKIVAIFREHYQNTRSLAVMLSRMKKDLKSLEDGPDDTYLGALALSKKEYNGIRKLNNDVRKKGAMSVHIVSNCDDIVLQSMQYMTSSDPNLLFCALLVCTGLWLYLVRN